MVVARRVDGVVRNVAIELPQQIVVVSPQHAGLRRPAVVLFVGEIVTAGLSILQQVVAALHAAVHVAPQARHGVGGDGLIVGHQVPELVVGAAGAAGPDVVGHDVAHDILRAILHAIPVVPLQRTVGCHQRLADMVGVLVVFIGVFLGVRLHLKEVLRAGGQHHGCAQEAYI